MKDNLCPVCGEGHLNQEAVSNTMEFNGASVTVEGLLHSVCEICGSDITGPDESRHNKRLILDSRRQAANLLLGTEIRACRKKWGLTQKKMAIVFGGGEVAFSKYENGDVIQSTSMDRLLRVAEAVPEAYQWLLCDAGIETNKLPYQMAFKSVLDTSNLPHDKKVVFALQYAKVPLYGEYDVANGERIINETKPTDSSSLSAA